MALWSAVLCEVHHWANRQIGLTLILMATTPLRMESRSFKWLFTAACGVVFFLSGWAKPLLHISVAEDSPDQGITLEWTTVSGKEDFVRASDDLLEWRLLPFVVEGSDSQAIREIEARPGPVFFQILRQTKADRPWVTPAATVPGVEFQLFFSEAIQAPVSYHVYLPPVYRLQPNRRFPVIFWLHGSGPGELGIPALTHYFHNAIQSRKMPPVIVVFANGLPQGMWCDSKDGQQPIETIFIHELIPHIDSHYRTIANRSGRLVEGFSMGGYGAARFGLKFPDRFGAFSMMGAGPLQLDFLEDHPRLVPLETRLLIFASVFGNDMGYFEAQSPWRLAETAAGTFPDDMIIRQIVGTSDSMIVDNRRFRQRLIELCIDSDYTELPDIGHNAMEVLQALGAANFEFYKLALR